ncbi:MAG: NADP-dependent oxidoreductase [Candidatus Woykebacteria bacterium]
MKAAQINKYGGVDVIEINENAPKPSVSEGQILVAVHEASINPIDWKIRAGYLQGMNLPFPMTLGGDFSGVVIEVGGNVTNFKVGDAVYGQGGVLNEGSGSFAEFAAASVNKVAAKPKNLDFRQASSLPLTGVSALQALEGHINLSKGQKILIHGGAGGIGTIAIQIAKALGAYAVTTVNGKDIDYVKSLGADETIDYKNNDFERKLKDFDAVFDTVGGDTTDKSFKVLKKGGTLVSMVREPSPELAEKYGITAIRQGTDSNPERLSRLSELVESGKIKAQIDKVFPLEQVREAFKHLEEGHPRGKVVLEIKKN